MNEQISKFELETVKVSFTGGWWNKPNSIWTAIGTLNSSCDLREMMPSVKSQSPKATHGKIPLVEHAGKTAVEM